MINGYRGSLLIQYISTKIMITLKKIVKLSSIILFSFLLVILLVFYLSIRQIDTTPYFETDYYSQTLDRVNSNLANRIKAQGKLKAGFAKINITPKIVIGKQNPENGEFNAIRLAGYGDGKFAKGIHDSIFVKSIATEINGAKIIFVSADLLLIPPEIAENVASKLSKISDVKREQLIFGATHTHSSIGNSIPSYVGEKFEGEYNHEVVEWLSKKITEVILKSISDLKESQIADGYIHAPELVGNRIIGEKGRLNDKLTVIKIRQDKGKTAVIGIYAAHATTLGAWNDQFSGDYPGYFQKEMEKKDVDLCMFFAGTVGSHTNKGIGNKFERSKFVGKSLADSVQKISPKLDFTENVNVQFFCSEIEIPELQIIYISDGFRLASSLAKKIIPPIDSVIIQAVKLNDLLWITLPCELSGEYAVDLKNALDLKGINSVITSFNGQYLGYVVPAKYYYYDNYESRLMGWFGPSFGDYLMELNFTIADSLTGFKL